MPLCITIGPRGPIGVEATRRSCVSRTVKNEPVSSFLCDPSVLFSPKWKAGEFSSWNLAPYIFISLGECIVGYQGNV